MVLFCCCLVKKKGIVWCFSNTPKNTRLKTVFSLMLSSTKRLSDQRSTKKQNSRNIFSKQNTSNLQKVDKPLPFASLRSLRFCLILYRNSRCFGWCHFFSFSVQLRWPSSRKWTVFSTIHLFYPSQIHYGNGFYFFLPFVSGIQLA